MDARQVGALSSKWPEIPSFMLDYIVSSEKLTVKRGIETHPKPKFLWICFLSEHGVLGSFYLFLILVIITVRIIFVRKCKKTTNSTN